MVIYVYRRISVMYGGQICESLPYLDMRHSDNLLNNKRKYPPPQPVLGAFDLMPNCRLAFFIPKHEATDAGIQMELWRMKPQFTGFISHNFIFNTAKLILGKVNLVSRNQQCSSGDEFATRSRKNNNNNNKIVHFKYNLRHLPWKIIVFLLGKHDGWMEIIRINFLHKIFVTQAVNSQNVL